MALKMVHNLGTVQFMYFLVSGSLSLRLLFQIFIGSLDLLVYVCLLRKISVFTLVLQGSDVSFCWATWPTPRLCVYAQLQ